MIVVGGCIARLMFIEEIFMFGFKGAHLAAEGFKVRYFGGGDANG